LTLHEEMAGKLLDETLSSMIPPKAKPLTQQDPHFTEVPLNDWARFIYGSTNGKPSGASQANEVFQL
jgi:hypothetical protein